MGTSEDEAKLATALIELNDWYRQQALQTLRLDHRAWMAALSDQDLRLLWFAGQPEANYHSIARGIGCSVSEVESRILILRRRLGARRRRLTRREWAILAGNVAKLGGGTITPRDSAPNPA